EPDVRRLVQARVQRGKVEVSVQARFQQDDTAAVSVSAPLVAGVVRALREVQGTHGLAGEVTLADVMRFPGTLEVPEDETALGDAKGPLLEAIDTALAGLDGMRVAEGDGLKTVMAQALDAVDAAAVRIDALSESEKAARREALLAKVAELRQELGLEEQRLYQEVVRVVERADVAEEVQRLKSHVAQARGLLAADGPCGKRLDFLAQELAREANTIGSKSASAALVREVVGLKAEVERLREQVQNVE
ncbi:MAG: YicC/YloC family endoribonuclease, partial [Vicinamibacteria bacterium]